MVFVLYVLAGIFATACASPGEIMPPELFDKLFSDRNPFYTYESFINAADEYPAFGNTGTEVDQRREVAAFFAHVVQESGGLIFIDEINKTKNCDYRFPCARGKEYFGRGPLQLSWNYNYEGAGKALALDLINYPELIAENALYSFRSSFWLWTATGCEDAMVNSKAGFGETIYRLGGKAECGKATETPQASNRILYYKIMCRYLNVEPDENLSCAAMAGAPSPSKY